MDLTFPHIYSVQIPEQKGGVLNIFILIAIYCTRVTNRLKQVMDWNVSQLRKLKSILSRWACDRCSEHQQSPSFNEEEKNVKKPSTVYSNASKQLLVIWTEKNTF